MPDRLKLLLKILGFLLVLGILFFLFRDLLSKIPPEQIKEFLKTTGIWGILVYIFIVLSCTVFSPLTSTFLWPVALMVYGFPAAPIYTVLGSVSGAVVNFWIARKFGRPVIKKLISRKGMDLVDKITFEAGLETLIILRILPTGLFDYISYAAGLTNIEFLPYFFITGFLSFLWNLLIFYFMDRILAIAGMLLYVLASYLLIVVSVWVVYLRIKLKKENELKPDS